MLHVNAYALLPSLLCNAKFQNASVDMLLNKANKHSPTHPFKLTSLLSLKVIFKMLCHFSLKFPE